MVKNHLAYKIKIGMNLDGFILDGSTKNYRDRSLITHKKLIRNA